MSKSFASQVGEFVAKSPDRMLAVFKQSAQDLVNEVQTPWYKGGNMRVDTGFLMNSGMAQLNGLPSGESVRPDEYDNKDYNTAPAFSVISSATLDDTIVFGWVANYAIFVEARFAFARLAAQNWDEIVQRNAKRLEKAIGNK